MNSNVGTSEADVNGGWREVINFNFSETLYQILPRHQILPRRWSRFLAPSTIDTRVQSLTTFK
jgi:hypothetical protein